MVTTETHALGLNAGASASLAGTPMLHLPVSVVDFETTGLSASSDRVVQASVVEFLGLGVPNVTINSLVNPECSIDPRVSAIHGITNAHVASAPVFGDLAASLLASLEGRVFAAYNASFDLRFLRAELRRLGMMFDTSFICVMELRQLIFATRRCKLVEACAEMGITLEHAHDASADAFATALLLQKYLEVLWQEGVTSIEQLGEFGHRAFLKSFGQSGFSASTARHIAVSQSQSPDVLAELEHECERLNALAESRLARFEGLLQDGLKADVRVHWDRLIVPLELEESPPSKPVASVPDKPDKSLKPDSEQKPSPQDAKYALSESFVDTLVPWKRQKKLDELKQKYQEDVDRYRERIRTWNEIVADYRNRIEAAKREHKVRIATYRRELEQFAVRQEAHRRKALAHNAQIDRERSGYEAGNREGIERALTRVLMNSELPEEFSDVVDVEFDAEQSCLRIIRQMPHVDSMPEVKGYRVIKKDRELREQTHSDAARKRFFDSVVYQMALRTAHEVLKGDKAKHINEMDVLCVIDGFDPATGHAAQLVLAHLHVELEEVRKLKLQNVDPQACFKELGGKAKGRPCNLKPVTVLAACVE